MKILFTQSDFWNHHPDFKQQYRTVIKKSFSEVRQLLPQVPPNLTFVVQANAHQCIPETGDGGYTRNAQLVLLSFDPQLPYGQQKLLHQLRSTVFHELNHAARYAVCIWHHDFLDSAIMEGLATVFERERAGSRPPWGQYDPKDAAAWLREITTATHPVPWREYMYSHPDGRKWIGYKVGTYLIDRAMQKSGKSIQELTIMECNQIKKIVRL